MDRVAIVNGIRTPFIKAWTLFQDIPAQRLGAICVRELLEITELDPALVDEVIFGAVSQPAEASNIARVISIYAGIPFSKRAYTVSRNCASGFEAVTSAYEKIISGFDEIVIAGGAESMSNIPLLFSKGLAKGIMRWRKNKGFFKRMKEVFNFRPSFLKPISALALGLTDPVCGLNMGQTAEILVKEFGITRREQDEFALRSHKLAVASRERLKEEIVRVFLPPRFEEVVEYDNGPRHNQTIEQLQTLRPYFDKYSGTITVGNSCQVTDGACALLLMKESKAQKMGYKPLGYIKSYVYTGLEPSRMGLGPAYAIPLALKMASLSLEDVGLFEINEAFAAQVIASLRLLESKDFAQKNFSLSEAVGRIEMDRLNVNGGAIAIGHPVGVTGSRLILTLLKEMAHRAFRYGVASLCVGGGQGGAIVLERE